MSKFAEKLQRSYKTVAPPMGFHTNAQVEENPPLLLVADITKSTAKATKDILGSGVDAVIINSAGLDNAALSKLNKNGGQASGGIIWDESTSITLDDAGKNSIDFVIFDVNTSIESINKEGPGKFLKIEPSLIPVMVKAINDVAPAADGVIVTNPDETVTVHSLLVCKAFSDILSKPLLFGANSKLSYSEMESLYNSGVNGVVLPPGISAADIADMKKSISKLPRNVKKKASSLRPVLPGISIGSSEPDKREEPDEDEDEDI